MSRDEQTSVVGLLQALADYRIARRRLLDVLGLRHSNRDPVPELAEHLVAALVGGKVADDRTQPGWDVTAPDGARIQVRTLSNTNSESWVNEHLVLQTPEVDGYALVVVEDLAVSAVLLFPHDLSGLGALLGKKHGDTANSLQFTRRNFQTIVDTREIAEILGLRVWLGSELHGPEFGLSSS